MRTIISSESHINLACVREMRFWKRWVEHIPVLLEPVKHSREHARCLETSLQALSTFAPSVMEHTKARSFLERPMINRVVSRNEVESFCDTIERVMTPPVVIEFNDPREAEGEEPTLTVECSRIRAQVLIVNFHAAFTLDLGLNTQN